MWHVDPGVPWPYATKPSASAAHATTATSTGSTAKPSDPTHPAPAARSNRRSIQRPSGLVSSTTPAVSRSDDLCLLRLAGEDPEQPRRRGSVQPPAPRNRGLQGALGRR